MSGGSYDYFSSRATEEVRRIASDLERMSARCTDPTAWGRDGVDPNDLAAIGAYLGALARFVTKPWEETWSVEGHAVLVGNDVAADCAPDEKGCALDAVLRKAGVR